MLVLKEGMSVINARVIQRARRGTHHFTSTTPPTDECSAFSAALPPPPRQAETPLLLLLTVVSPTSNHPVPSRCGADKNPPPTSGPAPELSLSAAAAVVRHQVGIYSYTPWSPAMRTAG
uniref:Uncharacterized protein n=1 Tax=Oryza brachyantha TaxID=4533 RepID=J3LKA1_ORYBR